MVSYINKFAGLCYFFSNQQINRLTGLCHFVFKTTNKSTVAGQTGKACLSIKIHLIYEYSVEGSILLLR